MRKRQSLRKFIAGVLAVVMVFGTAFAGAPISAKAAGETVKIARDEIQKISAKSFHGSTPLDNIYDGNLGNYVDTDYNDTSTEQPMWFQFELKETAKVNQVKIHPRSDGTNGRPDSYKIYAGESEDALSVVASGAIDPDVVEWKEVSFNAVDAKVVRVELTSETFPAVHVVTVAEVEIYKEVVEEPEKTPEEELRDEIRTKMAEAKKLYVKGEYTFAVDQQYDWQIPDVQERLDDPNADVDKLTWGVTYMDQLLEALNNPVNKLSAIEKEVYNKIVERESIDPSIYTVDSWKAYKEAEQSARGVLNGQNSDEYMKEKLDAMEKAFAELVEVDSNLVELGKLAEEKAAVEYADYTRESWRAFKGALYDVEDELRKSNPSIDEAVYNSLKSKLETAFAGLKKGTESTEYGVHENDGKSVWKGKEKAWKVKGGQLYVEDEKQNGDGTTTLTVRWINDGLDPESGRLMNNVNIYGVPDYSERKFSESDWKKVYCLQVNATTPDGESKTTYWDESSDKPIESFFDGDSFPNGLNGFTKKVVVPTGSNVKLSLECTNNGPETYSLFVYHTAEQVETPKHEHEGVAFENAITEPVTELKEGTYYLDADIAPAKPIAVSGDVKLCLNNHSIAVGTIKLPEGASLTICDCGENGAITSKLAKVMEITGGTVTLESGTIRSTSTSTVDGAMYIKSGMININGGRVETTAKHAIYGYATSATVNVTGGEIVNGGMADDSEFKNRGSIVAYNSTTVNISGGTVAGVWSGSGASRVNISGGTITGSVINANGEIVISDKAEITNTKDWAVAARKGTTTITGGTITGKTDGLRVGESAVVDISGGTITGEKNGLNVIDPRYPKNKCYANVKISGGNITGGEYGADLNKLDPMANYYMFSVSGTPTIKGKTADILVSKEKQVYGQINGVAYAGEPLTIAGNNEDFKENTVIVVVKAPIDPADVLDRFEYQSEEFELAEGEEALVLKVIPEKVTVTFDVDGQKTDVEIVKGEAIGANLPENPSKEGYTFKGWNTKEDGTGEAVTADTKANEDMTVYAVFEKIVVPVEKVTVTFDVDGQKTDVEIVKGEAIGANLPEDPSKEGYTFKGWNTKEDGTGEAVTAKTKADKNMVVYAIFEKNTAEVVPPFMSSVTVENGKVTIVLKDKPTKAPTIEDVKLQMNLNGAGNKDVKITGFKYDGDKTITLTFEKIASTDKKQTFTMTVTLGDQSVTTKEITVPAKTTSEDEKTEDDKNNVKTGDNTPITALVVTMLLAAGIVAATLFYRRKRVK